MSQLLLYLLKDFVHAPTNEVGTLAKALTQFETISVQLPRAAVIPKNTLKIIAQANNLQAKVYKLLQETNYSSDISKEKACEKLQHLITLQVIPKELARVLLQTYQTYFDSSFVLIRNAEDLPVPDVELHNIHSNTNFVAAVLEVWAAISVKKLKQLLLGTNNTHEILFPSSIFIQEQLEPQVSGIAYSFDLSTGSKNQITILSNWGVYNKTHQEFDRYHVDIRTKNVTYKQIQTKQNQSRRVLGKLRIDQVLAKYQNHETLTQQQTVQIATLVDTVKKKHLSQVAVMWAIQNNTLYLESVAPADTPIRNYNIPIKSLFKVYTKVHSLTTSRSLIPMVDGIAVYNSGNLVAASATHPSEVVKTKQKDHLITAISRVLKKQITTYNKPLLYRANNFTSNEFKKLKFASVYETTELNPYLGFRGGLRYLAQPESFKIELTSLHEVVKSVTQQVVLILPFVRSPEELAQLTQLINKQGLTQHSNFSLWLELSTPENILNLAEYPTHLVQGLVVNMQSIHALLTGIDPHNTDITVRYTKNSLLLKKLVVSALRTTAENSSGQSLLTKPEFFIDIDTYDKALVEQLCDLPITGFIFNQEVTELAKKCIIERQKSSIL